MQFLPILLQGVEILLRLALQTHFVHHLAHGSLASRPFNILAIFRLAFAVGRPYDDQRQQGSHPMERTPVAEAGFDDEFPEVIAESSPDLTLALEEGSKMSRKHFR